MKTRSIVLTLALCFVAAAWCFAADSNMGTWKLDVAKSKLDASGEKNETVVYSMDGDKVKVTVDGIDKDGKTTHNEWTGKYDGKDYPVTGDPASDTRSYKKIDDHTFHIIVKKAGKDTMQVHIVNAADGKSRTVTFYDATGKTVTSTAVYDKQ